MELTFNILFNKAFTSFKIIWYTKHINGHLLLLLFVNQFEKYI